MKLRSCCLISLFPPILYCTYSNCYISLTLYIYYIYLHIVFEINYEDGRNKISKRTSNLRNGINRGAYWVSNYYYIHIYNPHSHKVIYTKAKYLSFYYDIGLPQPYLYYHVLSCYQVLFIILTRETTTLNEYIYTYTHKL